MCLRLITKTIFYPAVCGMVEFYHTITTIPSPSACNLNPFPSAHSVQNEDVAMKLTTLLTRIVQRKWAKSPDFKEKHLLSKKELTVCFLRTTALKLTIIARFYFNIFLGRTSIPPFLLRVTPYIPRFGLPTTVVSVDVWSTYFILYLCLVSHLINTVSICSLH